WVSWGAFGTADAAVPSCDDSTQWITVPYPETMTPDEAFAYARTLGVRGCQIITNGILIGVPIAGRNGEASTKGQIPATAPQRIGPDRPIAPSRRLKPRDLRRPAPLELVNQGRTPNDPLFPQQWGLIDSGATRAWEQNTKSHILVAVLG